MKTVLNKVKKIIINSIILILSILAIMAIYIFIQLNIMKNEYVNILGYSFFKVETGSMAKEINIEDIIIVKLNASFEENDIITYKKDNNFVTHRVISIEDEKVITKGDRNNSEDEPIKKADIIGKVVFTIKNIRVWKKVFSDIKVIISIAITIILLVLIIAYKEKMGEENV